MNRISNQKGFAPIVVIVAVLIIGAVSVLVVKNTVFNNPAQPESTLKAAQSTSSAQVKVSPSPTISKNKNIIAPTLASQKTTPIPTKVSSGTGTNNTSTPTNTSVPSNTPAPTTGTLKGTIKDSAGNPLANANMELSCSNCGKLRNGDVQSEQADGSGNYNISNLPAISINIKPFWGHWGETKTVSIVGGQTTSLDLTVSADTTVKPTISITKGPYTSGVQSPCFDVSATHANCYQLSASFATDNDNYSTVNLTSGGGCNYVGTICNNINGSHTLKIKARAISTNTESDVVTLPYNLP